MEQTSRERVLDEIRAELARYNPLEQACVPLEVIVEASVRLIDEPGTGYRVVDDQGRPRTRVVDGSTIDLTIRDLVAEIRDAHPMLFEPVETRSAADVPDGFAILPAAATEPPEPGEPVETRSAGDVADGFASLPAAADGPPKPAALRRPGRLWHRARRTVVTAALVGSALTVYVQAFPIQPDRTTGALATGTVAAASARAGGMGQGPLGFQGGALLSARRGGETARVGDLPGVTVRFHQLALAAPGLDLRGSAPAAAPQPVPPPPLPGQLEAARKRMELRLQAQDARLRVVVLKSICKGC